MPQIRYGLAISLAYANGEEEDNFLVQMISTPAFATGTVEERVRWPAPCGKNPKFWKCHNPTVLNERELRKCPINRQRQLSQTPFWHLSPTLSSPCESGIGRLTSRRPCSSSSWSRGGCRSWWGWGRQAWAWPPASCWGPPQSWPGSASRRSQR